MYILETSMLWTIYVMTSSISIGPLPVMDLEWLINEWLNEVERKHDNFKIKIMVIIFVIVSYKKDYCSLCLIAN